jgi:hypothetical protein
MDPFIEASGLWGDFNQNLIIAIQRDLNQVLPRRYVARSAERTYIDESEPDEGARRHIEADVQVRPGATALPQAPTAVALGDAPATSVEIEALILDEHREVFIEIFDLDRGRELVTCIEALSPSNKRYRSKGWELYTRKRHVFLSGHANFVELDFLRGGRRMPMASPWPPQPFYIFTVHKELAPKGTAYPAHFRAPLPAVPIPLRPPDKEILLAFQTLFERLFVETRLIMDIDYKQDLRPALTKDEEAWVRQLLEAWRPS